MEYGKLGNTDIEVSKLCVGCMSFGKAGTMHNWTLDEAESENVIKKYAEQKKADWILNGGIDKEWDSYLKKMEQYGLSDYLAIKQKYFDQYQKSLSETEK